MGLGQVFTLGLADDFQWNRSPAPSGTVAHYTSIITFGLVQSKDIPVTSTDETPNLIP
jgi:hypothetical protein